MKISLIVLHQDGLSMCMLCISLVRADKSEKIQYVKVKIAMPHLTFLFLSIFSFATNSFLLPFIILINNKTKCKKHTSLPSFVTRCSLQIAGH